MAEELLVQSSEIRSPLGRIPQFALSYSEYLKVLNGLCDARDFLAELKRLFGNFQKLL